MPADPPAAPGESRWSAADSRIGGRDYAAHFAELASLGTDVHGEATMCASLVPVGGRVLDAGCGTGRVAIRLTELGYECVGVDSDESMLAEARATSSEVTWLLADLVDIDRLSMSFALIVAAGNVIPLLAPGTEPTVVAGLANRLAPGGLLVAGFGLDAAHLPLPEPPFGLTDYDAWCATGGLSLEQRFSTWACDPYSPNDGYVVSLHRQRG
jgi:SAM-dependent methyltransferase